MHNKLYSQSPNPKSVFVNTSSLITTNKHSAFDLVSNNKNKGFDNNIKI